MDNKTNGTDAVSSAAMNGKIDFSAMKPVTRANPGKSAALPWDIKWNKVKNTFRLSPKFIASRGLENGSLTQYPTPAGINTPIVAINSNNEGVFFKKHGEAKRSPIFKNTELHNALIAAGITSEYLTLQKAQVVAGLEFCFVIPTDENGNIPMTAGTASKKETAKV